MTSYQTRFSHAPAGTGDMHCTRHSKLNQLTMAVCNAWQQAATAYSTMQPSSAFADAAQ